MKLSPDDIKRARAKTAHSHREGGLVTLWEQSEAKARVEYEEPEEGSDVRVAHVRFGGAVVKVAKGGGLNLFALVSDERKGSTGPV